MKTMVTALCVLCAANADVKAQTGAAMYGVVDLYLGHISNDRGASVFGMNDGALTRSRIGFRGAERFGNGIELVYDLEQGINFDSGGQADASRMFDRQAWIGLKGPAGELRVGRQNTALFSMGNAIDYTDSSTFGSVRNTFGVPTRYDNDISYVSPRRANVQLSVHYAPPESIPRQHGGSGIVQLALDYTGTTYRFGYAGLTSSPAAFAPVGRQVRYHNLYWNAEYGSGKVYLSYSRSNNITSNASGNTSGSILSNVGSPGNSYPGTDRHADRFYDIYQISADYRVVPRTRIGALWGVIDDRSGGGAGAAGGSIGAVHDVSKRTVLYAVASWLKNQPNAGFRFGGSGAVSANLAGDDVNGRSLTGLQVGIVHRF